MLYVKLLNINSLDLHIIITIVTNLQKTGSRYNRKENTLQLKGSTSQAG